MRSSYIGPIEVILYPVNRFRIRGGLEGLYSTADRRNPKVALNWDWVLSGRCLAFYCSRWGKIRPRDHLAEVMVVVAAIRVGVVLASKDLKQMKRWSWVLSKLGRNLEVREIKD